MDLDAASHQLKSPEKVLAQQERGEEVVSQGSSVTTTFRPFVASADE
jgi:hypothetical protein